MAARRPQHKSAHQPCPYGATSWADCDDRAREAYGRCSALTKEGHECTKWATDEIGDRRYCDQHATSIVAAEIAAHRREKRQAELDARITAFLEWTRLHPSVWDRRGGGGGGESNPSLPEDPAASTQSVSVAPGGPAKPRTPVVWSAASGDRVPVRK